MEISYTDLSGKELEIDQLPDIESYIKVFKENNRLRKQEFYDDSLLSDIIYFLGYGSSHQDLLVLNLEIIKISEIQDLDIHYTKYHNFTYYNSKLKRKSVSVYINDKSIFYQEISIENNSPVYHKTRKYYESDSGYEFTFSYHESGLLGMIIVSNDLLRFNEQYWPSDLDLIHNFECWQKYSSYYSNAEPAVPVDMVIV